MDTLRTAGPSREHASTRPQLRFRFRARILFSLLDGRICTVEHFGRRLHYGSGISVNESELRLLLGDITPDRQIILQTEICRYERAYAKAFRRYMKMVAAYAGYDLRGDRRRA